jgi:hypothetical protein
MPALEQTAPSDRDKPHRPLLGKAFDRRFKKFEALLQAVPESQTANKGWRAIGAPPTHAEVEASWEDDRTTLGGT